MVVLISGDLKNKIHSFRLFQKGQCILHPDPYNHTWHKENPQPSPITTSKEGQSSRDCSKLHLHKLGWSIPAGYSVQGGISWKNFIKSKPRPRLVFWAAQNLKNLPLSSLLTSSFPTSPSFSWPHNPVPSFPVLFSHHPLSHLQCHLCQLWLQFFGFFKTCLQEFFLTASWMQNMSLN